MSSKPNILPTADRPQSFIEQVMGPDKGRTISLTGNKLTIGRTEENDIVVPSDAVSRVHAYLMNSDGAWFIRDNKSKNGIQVNGARVNEAWLNSGDIVQVGSFVFRFTDPGAEASAAASARAMEPQAADPMGAAGMGMDLNDVTGVTQVKKKPNRRVLIYGVLVLLGGLVWFSQNNNGGSTDANSDKKPAAEGSQAATQEDLGKLKDSLAEVEKGVAELTSKGEEKLDDVKKVELERLKSARLKLQVQIRQLSLRFSAAKSPDTEEADLTKIRARIAELESVDLTNRGPNDEEANAITAELRKLKRQLDLAHFNPRFKETGGETGVAQLEDPTLKEAEVEMSRLDWTNSSLREAEQFFRKGQREYMSANYQRAIDSFQTALSFYRGHRLAEKYLRLSLFEVESQAKKHMEMGLQYFESLQFQRAVYHFGEVVNLMQHRPQEAMVLQSEKYISLSKRRLQAAELFPDVDLRR